MSRRQGRIPILTPGDAMLAVTEAAHFVLGRTLSEQTGDRAAKSLARFAVRLRPAKRERLERLYLEMIGHRRASMPAPDHYVASLITTLLQQRTMYARLGTDPAWRPRLELTGVDALSMAVRRGRGVVLWQLPLEMTGLLVRMACADHGWRLHQMTHWQHGQSISRFGMRLFNSRDCRVESEFGPHFVLTDDDKTSALTAARRVLREGGLVGFRGIGWAKRPAYYSLFSGHMHLALGAPATARRVGAALFAVTAGRVEGGYRVDFKPMQLSGSRPLEDVGAEFAALLECAATDSPSLWPVASRQWQPGPLPAGLGS